MDEKIKSMANQAESKHKKQADEHNKKIKSLQLRVKDWRHSETTVLFYSVLMVRVFIVD